MADWRQALVDKIVELAKAEGMVALEQDRVMAIIKKMAEIEKPLAKAQRLGAIYVFENYTDRGWARMWGLIGEGLRSSPDHSVAASSGHVLYDEKLCLQEELSGEAFKMQCTIAIKWKGVQDIKVVFNLMQTLLISQIGFDAVISRVASLGNTWFDLGIKYNKRLQEVYSKVFESPFVLDAVTKPVSTFGKRTVDIQ